MRASVVDASALAAVVFDEPEAHPIASSVTGRLLAPTLIRYELASVCATKLARHPKRAQEIEQRYRLVDELGLELYEPDWATLPALARRFELSAYDAAYLQLAIARNAPIVTLDARLAGASDAAR